VLGPGSVGRLENDSNSHVTIATIILFPINEDLHFKYLSDISLWPKHIHYQIKVLAGRLAIS
jgi:hypothetical protein